jgi:hypothetical protein
MGVLWEWMSCYVECSGAGDIWVGVCAVVCMWYLWVEYVVCMCMWYLWAEYVVCVFGLFQQSLGRGVGCFWVILVCGSLGSGLWVSMSRREEYLQ